MPTLQVVDVVASTVTGGVFYVASDLGCDFLWVDVIRLARLTSSGFVSPIQQVVSPPEGK